MNGLAFTCRARRRTIVSAGALAALLLSGCGGQTPVVVVPPGGGSLPPGTPSVAPTSLPTATSSQTPAQPQVIINEPPSPAVVQPGSDIKLSGTVSGLNGRELWIVSRADFADQLYYLTLRSPVTKADGPWNVTDESVGDDSDRGHNRLYLAIAADGDCANSLAAVKPDVEEVLSFPRLPSSCQQIGAPRTVSFPRS
jgi:hypothetical protein